MCCFFGKGKAERGLLRARRSFPIPIKEEFGGEVVIGWKKWGFTTQRLGVQSLVSRTFWTAWTPGQPLVAIGSVAQRRGIFAHDEDVWESDYDIVGTVALWGNVLHFEHESKLHTGCISQFAYPLDLFVGSKYINGSVVASSLAADWGPFGTDVFYGGEKVAWKKGF